MPLSPAGPAGLAGPTAPAPSPTRRHLLLTAGAALLSACSVGQRTAGDAVPKAQVKPGTTLQWMYWSSPGPWIEANQKEATLFEQQQSKNALKIEQQNVPSGQPFLDKLTALVAGGTPPDVAEIMPWDVPQFQAKKALLNLTPYQKRDKYDLSDFFAAGFDQYRWTADGKPGGTIGADLWGVPRDFPTRALGYNADLLQASGAKLPAGTWNDSTWNPQAFLDAALRVTKRDGNGPNGVSVWGWNGHEGLQEWMPWVFNFGGEFVSPDGRESRFDNPKTVEAFQFLADLQNKHKVVHRQPAGEEGLVHRAFGGALGRRRRHFVLVLEVG